MYYVWTQKLLHRWEEIINKRGEPWFNRLDRRTIEGKNERYGIDLTNRTQKTQIGDKIRPIDILERADFKQLCIWGVSRYVIWNRSKS